MKKLSLLFILSMLPVLALAQNDSPLPLDGLTLTPTTYDWGQSAHDYRYYEEFEAFQCCSAEHCNSRMVFKAVSTVGKLRGRTAYVITL